MSQHDPDADPEPIDTTDAEDAELLVADPDDYHESQRLKEIHDARQEVRQIINQIDPYTSDEEHNRQRGELCFAVTAYITELEPLIEATDYDDSLSRTHWDSLRQYADLMGYDHEIETRSPYEHSIYIFRQANQFLADVKPIVTEDETDEWEV